MTHIADMWPMEVPAQCSNRPVVHATSTEPCEDNVQSASPAGLSEEELKARALAWIHCQCRVSPFSEILYTRPLMSTHIVRTGNSSSPCFRRVSRDMLIGYIVKRRGYRGNH